MKRSTDKFDYMLLDRMRTDCEYFMTYGGRNVKFLWAKDVDEQCGNFGAGVVLNGSQRNNLKILKRE